MLLSSIFNRTQPRPESDASQETVTQENIEDLESITESIYIDNPPCLETYCLNSQVIDRIEKVWETLFLHRTLMLKESYARFPKDQPLFNSEVIHEQAKDYLRLITHLINILDPRVRSSHLLQLIIDDNLTLLYRYLYVLIKTKLNAINEQRYDIDRDMKVLNRLWLRDVLIEREYVVRDYIESAYDVLVERSTVRSIDLLGLVLALLDLGYVIETTKFKAIKAQLPDPQYFKKKEFILVASNEYSLYAILKKEQCICNEYGV